jgi:hypothetical protein
MDIHMPEIFGWHPKKKEEKGEKSSEPSPYTKGIVMAALILMVLALLGLTGYYFSEYLGEVFKTWR